MRYGYVVLLLMFGLMVAPVLAQDALPRVETASCWMELPDGIVEGDNLECGYLIVPEDRSDTSSPTIQLAYAILHAPC